MRRLELLQIDVTQECPLHCSHCSNSSGPSVFQALPLSSVLAAISDAADFGCKSITLSGGEPLLYAGLSELLTHCRYLGFETTAFTTGIRDKRTRGPLSAKEWERVRCDGLQNAVFSAYSSRIERAFHNTLVRMSPLTCRDAFAVNEAALRNAKQAGISVEVQYLPTDRTIDGFDDLVSWAADLGVRRLHVQFPTAQGRNASSAILSVSPTSEAQLRRAVTSRVAHTEMEIHVSRLWRARWGLAPRLATPTQLIVRADGTAVACNACKYTPTNVRTHSILHTSLREIWLDPLWPAQLCDCESNDAEQLRKKSVTAGSPSVRLLSPNELFQTCAK